MPGTLGDLELAVAVTEPAPSLAGAANIPANDPAGPLAALRGDGGAPYRCIAAWRGSLVCRRRRGTGAGFGSLPFGWTWSGMTRCRR